MEFFYVFTTAFESFYKLYNISNNTFEVQSKAIVIVAAIGIVVNGFSAWLFTRDSKGDLNIRGAFLHLFADTLVSVGVVITGILIYFTKYNWLDPLISLAISAVIIYSGWNLLMQSLRLSLNGVPEQIDVEKVKDFLLSQQEVIELHDLHIWAIGTSNFVLMVHLVYTKNSLPDDNKLQQIRTQLWKEFNITHSTLQVETNPKICMQHLRCND